MKEYKVLQNAFDINPKDKSAIRELSKKTGISEKQLRFYCSSNSLPQENDLEKLCSTFQVDPIEFMLKAGVFNCEIKTAIQDHASAIYKLIKKQLEKKEEEDTPTLVFETELGKLYQGDCLQLLPHIQDDSVDLVFADPPFNLKKLYPSNIDDNLKSDQYIKWCEKWIDGCVRILKPGGSLFLWNIPKWNSYFAGYLNERLTFRHWISVDIKCSLPIQGRLYPSHYSLLYYCKGIKPCTFAPDRLQMEICPHCLGDLKDYGGYKDKMNPLGVSLSDVWYDIPPVRHAKYKKRNGINELSVKLMDRIIEMSSNEGDTIFDPFGGSGTTYSVAEIKKRKWIGIEIGPIEDILNRFENIKDDKKNLKTLRESLNGLFTEKNKHRRTEKGLWTDDSFSKGA